MLSSKVADVNGRDILYMKAVQPAAKEPQKLRPRSGLVEGVCLRRVWKIFPGCLNFAWKYQHPPSGRTGESFPWLFPLITRISGPSGPSGNALGMLDRLRSIPASQEKSAPAYFSGSSSWYEGSIILYCFGRSIHSWRPRGSGLPGSWTGISAWITGNRTLSKLGYNRPVVGYLLPRPCERNRRSRLLVARGEHKTRTAHIH
jgi:hypothetical protein